ncbi:MAG: alpha/beta hydrolase [Chloroflexota bacterium]|nr:alpha/beta hydrolase [Chloroflexota bacterium]
MAALAPRADDGMRPSGGAERSRDKGSPFLYGRTSFIAYSADPRFSYCLYLPDEIRRICVYVHGTYRDAAFYRDQLTDFAVRNQALLVCPLFPAGLIEPRDVENYKLLRFHEIRYDRILLGMLDEISQRYAVPCERFMLGGFSGGAQFAHRFAYFHAERLSALSLAAPGRVTLLDESLDWWSGVRDAERLFGRAIDIAALRRLPIQLLVGENDDDDITIADDDPWWAPGANLAGATRRERLASLFGQYQRLGCDATLEVIEGCGHEWTPLRDATTRFFEVSFTSADED